MGIQKYNMKYLQQLANIIIFRIESFIVILVFFQSIRYQLKLKFILSYNMVTCTISAYNYESFTNNSITKINDKQM